VFVSCGGMIWLTYGSFIKLADGIRHIFEALAQEYNSIILLSQLELLNVFPFHTANCQPIQHLRRTASETNFIERLSKRVIWRDMKNLNNEEEVKEHNF